MWLSKTGWVHMMKILFKNLTNLKNSNLIKRANFNISISKYAGCESSESKFGTGHAWAWYSSRQDNISNADAGGLLVDRWEGEVCLLAQIQMRTQTHFTSFSLGLHPWETLSVFSAFSKRLHTLWWRSIRSCRNLLPHL